MIHSRKIIRRCLLGLAIGGCVIGAWAGGNAVAGWIKRSDVGRLTSSPDEVLIPPGGEATTVISLRNDGWRAVRIESVAPSCSCVALENMSGRVVEPGASLDLPMRFEPPVKGHEVRTIAITHSGVGSPLLINATVFGAAELPYVNHVHPTELVAVPAGGAAKVSVVTYEQNGSAWIGSWKTARGLCALETTVTEEPLGVCTRRTYHLTVRRTTTSGAGEPVDTIWAVTPEDKRLPVSLKVTLLP